MARNIMKTFKKLSEFSFIALLLKFRVCFDFHLDSSNPNKAKKKKTIFPFIHQHMDIRREEFQVYRKDITKWIAELFSPKFN